MDILVSLLRAFCRRQIGASLGFSCAFGVGNTDHIVFVLDFHTALRACIADAIRVQLRPAMRANPKLVIGMFALNPSDRS